MSVRAVRDPDMASAQLLIQEIRAELGSIHIGNPPTKGIRPLPATARAAQCLCPDARA